MAGLDRLQLRLASAADSERIARLHADSWRRHYRGAYSDAFLDGDVGADRRAVWARRLQKPDAESATIIAEEKGGSLVGFVHVVFDDDPTWGALIDNIHVAGERQRGGVGTRLMAAAAEAVIERRAPGGLYLWVLEQNVAARAFYEARGGRFAERAPVDAPGGVPARLNGSPLKMRYVWPEPALLQRHP
ncbi:MAG: GNAT family N-acetyltransferase [Actinobacteria bacterium]|nr:MAG: GNAT family N-acetyltransferase [Actinomycetota bacterium]